MIQGVSARGDRENPSKFFEGFPRQVLVYYNSVSEVALIPFVGTVQSKTDRT